MFDLKIADLTSETESAKFKPEWADFKFTRAGYLDLGLKDQGWDV